MYSLDIERYIRELTPPNRRTAKRLALLNVLLKPISSIYQQIELLDNEVKERAKIVPQVAVVQYYLNQLAGGTVVLVENKKFNDNIPPDSVLFCLLPSNFNQNNLYLLQYFLDSIKPAGLVTGLQLMNPSFRIYGVAVVEVSGRLNATVNVFNPLGLTLQYSINDVNYQSSNVFTNLLATEVFYVRLSSDHSVKLRSYNVRNVAIEFEIQNVILVKTTSIKATVQMYNPSNVAVEYSIDNVNYQLSNVFLNLNSTNTFYARLVSNPSIVKSFVRIDSIVTDDFYVPSATNKLKTLVPATGTILDVSHFGTVPQRTYVDETGYVRPVWMVCWDLQHDSFTAAGKKAWELGLSALMIGGQVNPDPSKNGVDYQDEGYYSFTSALPYYNRGLNQYGVSGYTPLWSNGSDEELYDLGREIGQSNMLGGADNVGGKTRRLITMGDIENNFENGSRQHRVFCYGAADKTSGYFVSLYSCVFIELGYTEDLETGQKKMYNYPDSNGNYSSFAYNKINEDWKIETTTTLSSRGLFNAKFVDYKNILPCQEQSFYFESIAPQGSQYPLDTNGNFINVNKFGSNKTVQHPLSITGTSMEWQAWYCRYKLNNKRNMFMPKLVADKGNFGRNEFSKASNGQFLPDLLVEEHSNRQIGRKYAFLFTLLGFINGLDLEIWDRAIKNDGGIDTYGGLLGAIEMLDNLGAVAEYRNLIPEYWNSQYSLDNGNTWLKTYAINWDTSTNNVLPVRISKSANKVLLTAYRPEGIEPLSFVAKTTIAGVVKYFHVGANDWQTTDYAYRDTALNALPNSAKHYYCQLFTF